jgi:hypothetical protein
MNKTSSSGNGKDNSAAAARESGKQEIQLLLDGHMERLLRFREEKDVRDIDLLSCNRRLRKLPDAEVAAGIASLHGQMREIVGRIADQVEGGDYRSTEEAIREMEISKRECLQALALLDADKALHVSCRSLKITVEIFSKMNRWLVERLDGADSLPAEQERKMLLSNAILAYEVTDFCIRFIENFHAEGVAEIRALHKRMLGVIGDLRKEQKTLRKTACARNIEPSLKAKILQDVEGCEGAIQVLDEEWTSYLGSIGLLEGHVTVFSKKLPSLRLLRDNAKARINVLSAVSVLHLVRTNVEAVESAIAELEKLELAPLSPERVKRLLHV